MITNHILYRALSLLYCCIPSKDEKEHSRLIILNLLSLITQRRLPTQYLLSPLFAQITLKIQQSCLRRKGVYHLRRCHHTVRRLFLLAIDSIGLHAKGASGGVQNGVVKFRWRWLTELYDRSLAVFGDESNEFLLVNCGLLLVDDGKVFQDQSLARIILPAHPVGSLFGFSRVLERGAHKQLDAMDWGPVVQASHRDCLIGGHQDLELALLLNVQRSEFLVVYRSVQVNEFQLFSLKIVFKILATINDYGREASLLL